MIQKIIFNKTTIRIIIGILITILIGYLYNELSKASDKVSKLQSDKISLVEGIKVLKNKNDNLVYQVQGLHVTSEELKKYNSILEKQLSDNNIKFKNLDNVITSQQTSIVNLKTLLKDSTRVIIKNDTIYTDTIKCFNYKDSFNTITGCIKEDSLVATFSSSTSLNIVTENIYKHKFLWWQWKVINRKVSVTSTNPSIIITDLNLYIPN